MDNLTPFFAQPADARLYVVDGQFQPDAYLRALGKTRYERRIVGGIITEARLQTQLEMDYHERRDELRAWLTAEILIRYRFTIEAEVKDGLFRWHRDHQTLAHTHYLLKDPFVQTIFQRWQTAYVGDVPPVNSPVYVLVSAVSYQLV